ncbi:hypothetical protein N2152v2_008460 [Parachlorella kessleri]
MSSQLVWELVKHNNAFLVKGVNGTVFSREAGNLYNRNSYKYSGLANFNSTVDVAAAKDGGVQVSKSRGKNASKPSAARAVSVIKKNARRTNYAVGAEAQRVRPDLKKAAVARASAVTKSQRVKKSAAASS